MDGGREIPELLFQQVPEYKELYETKDDKEWLETGTYLFFGEFCRDLSREILSDPKSNFVINSLNFINELSKRKDTDTQNLLGVGILEMLYTENLETRERVRVLLNAENKKTFKALSEHFR